MKKQVLEYIKGLTDEKLVELFNKNYGHRDEIDVRRRQDGSVFIEWLNDNGFRTTGKGTTPVINMKAKTINLDFLENE